MSLEEVKKLVYDRGFYNKRKARDIAAELEQQRSPSKQKRSPKKRATRGRIGVMPEFRPTDVSEVEKKGNIFSGKEMCVISHDEREMSKAKIETLITAYGGTFVQNPGSTTDLLVAGKQDTIRVRNFCSIDPLIDRSYDIVRPSWLVDSVSYGKQMPLSSKYVIFLTEESKSQLATELDEFGDMYAVDCTKESLRDCFEQVRAKFPHPFVRNSAAACIDGRDEPDPLLKSSSRLQRLAHSTGKYRPSRLSKIETPKSPPPDYQSVMHCFEDAHQEFLRSPLSMFRGFDVYLDCYAELGNPSIVVENSTLPLVGSVLILYGAKLSTRFHPGITHVVISEDDLDATGRPARREAIRLRFAAMRETHVGKWLQKHYVTTDWVWDSVKRNSDTPLEEKNYLPC